MYFLSFRILLKMDGISKHKFCNHLQDCNHLLSELGLAPSVYSAKINVMSYV